MKHTNYERLECLGLWRGAPDSQRRDVIVTFGKSTLVFLDNNDNPIGHWSLGAVRRVNPYQMPAIFSPDMFHPDESEGETLQLDDVGIIAHIEYLQTRANRGRARPGRVRFWIGLMVLVAGFVGVRMWLPDVIAGYATQVIPEVTVVSIGQRTLTQVQQITGVACDAGGLSERLDSQVFIADMGGLGSVGLPSGIVLIDDDVARLGLDVVAGYVVLEQVRADMLSPVHGVFRFIGLREAFLFFTTGRIRQNALDGYGEWILTEEQVNPEPEVLISAMARAGVSSAGFFAAHPFYQGFYGVNSGDYPPVLSDTDWMELQRICLPRN